MSPFLITTTRPLIEGGMFGPGNVLVSRRAVATLEEAREWVSKQASAIMLALHEDPKFSWDGMTEVMERLSREIWGDDRRGYEQLDSVITESGGTISLPGGETIEVEPGPGQQQMREDLRVWGVSMDTRDALDETAREGR